MIVWPNGSKTRPLISSPFGPRNLSNPLASKNHLGVDMYGWKTVHSIADGEVVFVGWYNAVGWSPVAGYMVWVQHDGFFSRYLHTAAGTARVHKGQKVKAGQALVDMGWSGLRSSYDTHVHLEITPGNWHTGNYGQVDPVPFIEARLGNAAGGGGGGFTVADNITLEYVDKRTQRTESRIIEIAEILGDIVKILGKRKNGASLGATADAHTETLAYLKGRIDWIADARIRGSYKGKSITALLEAILAAVTESAKEQGLDMEKVNDAISTAVKESLDDIEITLKASSDE